MDDQIADLEIKFAFQEDLLGQLNEALISQQKQIDELTKRLELLQKFVESGGDEGIKDQSLEVPPPHY